MARTINVGGVELTQLQIQNALRIVGQCVQKKPIEFIGDLVYVNDKFVGRTQDFAEELINREN